MRRHHPTEQIIGDKKAKIMTRNRLRNESCLLRKIEPSTMRDALEDEGWCKDMEEEIEQKRKKCGV